MTVIRILSLIIMCCIVSAVFAEPKTFTINKSSRNLVMFTSKAPMETVEGKTSDISGSATLDVDNLISSATGRIEVDLTTIDTGIGLRNQHMRENHLETETYPTAVFTLKGLSSPSSGTLAENSTVNAVAEGTFDIHGITKDYSIPVTLTRTGNNIQVEGGWSLLLDDHQIKRPEFLVMRLSEEQKITVKFEMSGN